ncbi:unnamed protein product [Camellia sinensis]
MIYTGERFRGSVISERFIFRSSIATTICTSDFDFTKVRSYMNSDPLITRILSSNGGSTIAKPIRSICYEDLNPIINDLQSISICSHVFHELCLQQYIEYCSNAKKKRCPVCKQAFSEANVSQLYFQSVGNLYQKLINCEDNPAELHREIDHSQQLSCKELAARCNVLGRGEARALHKLRKAKEKIKKLKARIQELKTAVEVKDNEVSRALKASKKTILKGDVLNDVDWNSNSSSISEDLAIEKNYFSRSEAASDTRSEVHRPCNKNGVSGSKSSFWTNEDWEFEVNLAETPVSKVMTRNPTVRHSCCRSLAKDGASGELKNERPLQLLLKVLKNNGGHLLLVLTHSLKHFEIECLGPFCLQSFLRIQSRIATVSPTDTVLMATKKMVEYGPCQFSIKSKNILMRVIAQNLPPESTPVEKVMSPNPECATVDTPIVDALRIMHDGKFLCVLVVDKDGVAVAVVDVLHITHAAIATVSPLSFGDHQLSGMNLSNARVSNYSSPNMMQKFWDSAMALSPDEEEDVKSDSSFKLASESIETTKITSLPFVNHTRSLTDLYEDEDHDNVVLASDSDLAAAVDHARLAGWKVLKLHLDHSGTQGHRRGSQSGGVEYAQSDVWASAYSALAAGAALIAGLSMLAYFRRNDSGST